jgi:hypothetical protein
MHPNFGKMMASSVKATKAAIRILHALCRFVDSQVFERGHNLDECMNMCFTVIVDNIYAEHGGPGLM